MPNTDLGGWGRGTWNLGAWGTALPVASTGLAGTTGLGSVVAAASASVSVTGLVGTSALASVIAGGGVLVASTGVFATGAVGDERTWSDINTSQTPQWQDASAF